LAVVLAVSVFLLPGCSKNANPATPPAPTGTAISKVGVTCRFEVTAADPDLDRVSVRIDWNSGDTSDWSEMFRSGDTMTFEHAWSAPGDYKMSAQAKDEKGGVSLWSNWHAVIIKDTVNVPPGIPTTPAGADTAYVDSICEFSTLAGDENGDRLFLQFEWGDGDTSDWSNLVPESTAVTISHGWFLPGEYSVVARARDEKGLVSDWSNVHVVVVVGDSISRPPGIPLVPVGPDTGHADSTYDFRTAGGDANGDSVMFQFDWGGGDTSAWSAPVPESTSVSMAHSWPVAGEFLVRARARDVKDLISDWSGAHVLTVSDSLR
jgi:hypothetical protein